MHPIIRAIAIIAIIGMSLLVTASLIFSREPAPKRPVEATAVLVSTVPVERVNTNFTVRTQGTVLPKIETQLSAEVSGTVIEVSDAFVPGGVFQAGDTLLRVDPTNYRVAVDQAEALVRQRQIEFDGSEKLRNSGYRAESDYASAAAQLASAKASLTRAKRDLERTAIRLPYDGIVRSKDVDIGNFVSPGTRLGAAFATASAEIRLPLTDTDLGLVNLPEVGETGVAGPNVRVSATRKGSLQSWDGQIVRTEGVVDEQSRVTYAVARIDDPYAFRRPGEPLPIGTFVRAEIQGEAERDVLRVPRSALRGSDQLLIMTSDNTLRIRTVAVTRTNSEWAFISAGAEAGEQVITTVLESPVNGMLVRTRNDTVDATSASAGNSGI